MQSYSKVCLHALRQLLRTGCIDRMQSDSSLSHKCPKVEASFAQVLLAPCGSCFHLHHSPALGNRGVNQRSLAEVRAALPHLSGSLSCGFDKPMHSIHCQALLRQAHEPWRPCLLAKKLG